MADHIDRNVYHNIRAVFNGIIYGWSKTGRTFQKYRAEILHEEMPQSFTVDISHYRMIPRTYKVTIERLP